MLVSEAIQAAIDNGSEPNAQGCIIIAQRIEAEAELASQRQEEK